MTPQDVSDLKAADKIRKVYADQGMRAICYGMGDGLDEVRNASLAMTSPLNLPAPGRCQAVYVIFQFCTALCFC